MPAGSTVCSIMAAEIFAQPKARILQAARKPRLRLLDILLPFARFRLPEPYGPSHDKTHDGRTAG
jgi:hypothetical protein